MANKGNLRLKWCGFFYSCSSKSCISHAEGPEASQGGEKVASSSTGAEGPNAVQPTADSSSPESGARPSVESGPSIIYPPDVVESPAEGTSLLPPQSDAVVPEDSENPGLVKSDASDANAVNLGASTGSIPPNDLDSSGRSCLSNLIRSNRHLLESELVRSVLHAFHLILDQSLQLRGAGGGGPLGSTDHSVASSRYSIVGNAASATAGPIPFAGDSIDFPLAPWELIYPKSKDGTPIYNPSGKYAVKLYWMGGWKKILLDDRMPLDADGKPLVVTSCVPHEIWPMLLCKALFKIATARWVIDPFRKKNGCPDAC
jgi:hypothetical protein